MLHHIAFGAAIVLREVLIAFIAIFLALMVLYHMFPQGWFKAVVNELKAGRAAYNNTFLEAYRKALHKHHTKKKLG